MMITTLNVVARYIGVCLLIMGVYSGLNIQVSWETQIVPSPRHKVRDLTVSTIFQRETDLAESGTHRLGQHVQLVVALVYTILLPAKPRAPVPIGRRSDLVFARNIYYCGFRHPTKSHHP